MRKSKIVKIILIILGIALLVLGLLGMFEPTIYERILCTWFGIFEPDVGDTGTWFSGTFTALAVIVAFYELKDSRDRFEEEHSSRLDVYTSWQTVSDIPNKGIISTEIDDNLHVIPVNRRLDTGIYRFLGICKKENLHEVKTVVNRVKNHLEKSTDYVSLAKLIYVDEKNSGANDREIEGKSILFPKSKESFMTIEGNQVGDIFDVNKQKIEKSIGTINSLDQLCIIYTDPTLNLYEFNVESEKTKRSKVKKRKLKLSEVFSSYDLSLLEIIFYISISALTILILDRLGMKPYSFLAFEALNAILLAMCIYLYSKMKKYTKEKEYKGWKDTIILISVILTYAALLSMFVPICLEKFCNIQLNFLTSLSIFIAEVYVVVLFVTIPLLLFIARFPAGYTEEKVEENIGNF